MAAPASSETAATATTTAAAAGDHDPTRPSELTAAWLSKAMGMEIEAIEVEPIGDIAGFASDAARVTITPSKGKEPPVYAFAKFPYNGTERDKEGMAVVFRRESSFYSTLAPKVSAAGVALAKVLVVKENVILLQDEVMLSLLFERARGGSPNRCTLCSHTTNTVTDQDCCCPKDDCYCR